MLLGIQRLLLRVLLFHVIQLSACGFSAIRAAAEAWIALQDDCRGVGIATWQNLGLGAIQTRTLSNFDSRCL